MSINYGRFAGQSGISSLTLNPGKTLLYAAAMDDVIYEFNVSSYDDIPGKLIPNFVARHSLN